MRNEDKNIVELKRHSTSHPCGNLVDGLPHDYHTETVAKRAKVGPRTQILLTMEKLFWMTISSERGSVSYIIVLHNEVQIWTLSK